MVLISFNFKKTIIMAIFELCSNPTSKWLMDTYGAIPLLVPSEQFKPLSIVRISKGVYHYMGALKNIFMPGSEINVALKVDEVSNASLEKTSSMKINLGFKILEGFFKALNLDSITLN